MIHSMELQVYFAPLLPPITLCIPFIPILTVWQTFDTVDTLPSEGAIHPQYSYSILPCSRLDVLKFSLAYFWIFIGIFWSISGPFVDLHGLLPSRDYPAHRGPTIPSGTMSILFLNSGLLRSPSCMVRLVRLAGVCAWFLP